MKKQLQLNGFKMFFRIQHNIFKYELNYSFLGECY